MTFLSSDRVDGVAAVLPSIDAVVATRSSAAAGHVLSHSADALRSVWGPGGRETSRCGLWWMLVTRSSATLTNTTGKGLCSYAAQPHLCRAAKARGLASARDSLSQKESTHNTSTLRLRRHRPALVEHGRARLHLRPSRVGIGLRRPLLLLFQVLHRFRTGRLLGLALRGG